MNHLRVVIIGAGLSGLASALRLEESAKANGIPLDLTLLESGAQARRGHLHD